MELVATSLVFSIIITFLYIMILIAPRRDNHLVLLGWGVFFMMIGMFQYTIMQWVIIKSTKDISTFLSICNATQIIFAMVGNSIFLHYMRSYVTRRTKLLSSVFIAINVLILIVIISSVINYFSPIYSYVENSVVHFTDKFQIYLGSVYLFYVLIFIYVMLGRKYTVKTHRFCFVMYFVLGLFDSFIAATPVSFLYGMGQLLIVMIIYRMIYIQDNMEELENTTAEFMRMFENLSGCAAWYSYYNEDGSVRELNWGKTLRKMLGYENEEDFPNTLESWLKSLHKQDYEEVMEGLNKAMYETGVVDQSYRMVCKDGSVEWFHALGNIEFFENGNPRLFYGSFINITKMMETEEELQKALVAAQQANIAKTVFLNNMSHDIRTPMNAIIGYTSLAQCDIDNRELVADFLQKIQISSDHLLSLINDVLDMSRIESGKIKIEETEVYMSELLRNINNIIMSDVRRKNIDFTIDSTEVQTQYVWCDKLRLNQIILNCLSNAVKYTPDYGKITMTVIQKELQINGKTDFEIRIKDNGIGMSKEFVEQIFEPFSREQTSTVSGIQGTGLGMSITKNIVDMMDGTIKVFSEKEVGTEVIINLALKISDKKLSENPEERKDRSLAGYKVLLVEDNELNREITENMLTEYGAQVEMAESGEAAIEIMKQASKNQFDIILMDIQMPGMDGYAASKQIRALEDPDKSSIPIIALTANAFVEDQQLSVDSGMNGHISKPIDIDIFLNTIKEQLLKNN